MPDISNDDKIDEIWVAVKTTGAKYELSKNQAILVREALLRGEPRVIHFDGYSIIIPYVVEFYRKSRFLKKDRQLPEQTKEEKFKPVSPEKLKKFREEIYRKIGKPMPKS